MLETVTDRMAVVRGALAWAPDLLVSAVIMLIAAIVAVAAHHTFVRLWRRVLGDRHPYWLSLLVGTAPITRLALVIFALFVVLPGTPLDADGKDTVMKILTLVGVILMGWICIKGVNVAAERYLVRFGSDTADSLLARKHVTQIRVLARTVNTILIIATIGAALMSFDSVRQYGVSLFASAGVAGVIAGFAARPVLSNLFAGIQIAMTQPIRIGDDVLVETEFGRIEEITSTYVVIALWDNRRLIVPLTHFIEKPFQNWTRDSSNMLGTVQLQVDYTTPVDLVRKKLEEIVRASPLFDGKVLKLQVTDAREGTLELRALVSARSSGDAFDLRCDVREKLVDFLQREVPSSLPRRRQEVINPALPSTRTASHE
jgi:small-conductance mechanosensitive channel